jgi:hypothetical protein
VGVAREIGEHLLESAERSGSVEVELCRKTSIPECPYSSRLARGRARNGGRFEIVSCHFLSGDWRKAGPIPAISQKTFPSPKVLLWRTWRAGDGYASPASELDWRCGHGDGAPFSLALAHPDGSFSEAATLEPAQVPALTGLKHPGV